MPVAHWCSLSHFLPVCMCVCGGGGGGGGGDLHDSCFVMCMYPCRLIPGLENLLLHYICLESGRGLMICPFHTTPGNVHSELLLCFQCTCSSMREVLRGRVLGCVLKEEDDEDNDDDSKGWESEGEIVKGSPVSSSPFAPQDSSVVEHGVLLECYAAQTFKAKASLQYWVIG